MQAKIRMHLVGAVVTLAALPGLGQAATAVPNFNIPGIPLPGFGHFETTVDVTLTKTVSGGVSSYQLTAANAPGTFLFQYDPDPNSAFSVDGSYSLTAHFDSAGNFVPAGSSLSITGTIPNYTGPGDAPGTTNLFSADLLGFNANATPATNTPTGLGFVTGNFGGWAAKFGVEESVYLYNFNVPNLMSQFGINKFKTATYRDATALTTVPIPAAAWSFGSALALLYGARRRKAERHE